MPWNLFLTAIAQLVIAIVLLGAAGGLAVAMLRPNNTKDDK